MVGITGFPREPDFPLTLDVRASDCQCTSCNGPGFDPSIRRHSGIWGAADEAVLNIVLNKREKSPPKKKDFPLSLVMKIFFYKSHLHNSFFLAPHLCSVRYRCPWHWKILSADFADGQLFFKPIVIKIAVVASDTIDNCCWGPWWRQHYRKSLQNKQLKPRNEY
jgi:hypothetical protein